MTVYIDDSMIYIAIINHSYEDRLWRGAGRTRRKSGTDTNGDEQLTDYSKLSDEELLKLFKNTKTNIVQKHNEQMAIKILE